MMAFLAANAHTISRDPKERSLRSDGRMVIRVARRDGVVDDVGKAMGNEAAKGVVVGVEIWTEELGDEVWFFVGGWSEIFARGIGGAGHAVGGGDMAAFVGAAAVWRYHAVFCCEQGLLFCLE